MRSQAVATQLTVLDLGELAGSAADPDTLCLRVELLSGQRLHEGVARSTSRPRSGSTVGVRWVFPNKGT